MHNNDFDKQIIKVLKEYNGLKYDSKNNILFGYLNVDFESSDEYLVEIDLTPLPRKFPNVKEVNERIPRKVDRHINTHTGTCCFTTTANEQIFLRKQIRTLSDIIVKIIIPFFQNNSFYELNHKYKNGEYEHYEFGILPGYMDILHLKDEEIALNALLMRSNKKKFGKNDPCFCGCNKIKNCHLVYYNNLFYVDDELIKQDINRIKTVFKIRN